GRFLNCLLIVTEHNKIRRHRTLDLVVEHGSFLSMKTFLQSRKIGFQQSRIFKSGSRTGIPGHPEGTRP
ncbi:MAG: hypothetical protein ABSB80_08460, partial [Methanoregula sp.]|uniref:hypothetical protein n=1 Tax=Methanoregula sp. TaxID=2052170 RepID=UPI003D1336F2